MLAKKIALNASVSFLARVIGIIIALISTALITRYLGEQGFGQYSLIFAYLYIFSALSDFGLYSLLSREIGRPGADEEKIISNIFTMRAFLLSVILFLGFILVLFFPYDAIVKFGVGVAIIFYFFSSLAQVISGIFQKYLKTYYLAISEVLSRVINLFLIVIFINYSFGILSFVWAMSISAFFYFLFTYIFARRIVKFKISFDFSFSKKIINDSIVLAASSVFILIYFKLNAVILAFFYPLHDVGVYSLSYKILETLIVFPAIFVGILMPLFSRFFNEDKVKFNYSIQSAFDILIIFLMPIVGGGFLISDKIINLITKEGFFESIIVFKILLFAVFFIFLGTLFNSLIIVIDKQKLFLKISAAGAFLSLLLNFILIPPYSYIGAAVSAVITEMFVTLALFFILTKNIKYFISFKKSILCVLATAIMIFFMKEFMLSLNIFVIIGASALIYFFLIWIFGVVNKKELKIFFQTQRSMPAQ